MRDLSRFETVSPLAMLGSGRRPPPSGPIRFHFDDMPEPAQPTLLRECFARVGVYYEFGALRDVPFRVDLAINAFPGLVVALCGLQGTGRRSVRELASEMRDDAALLIN